MLQQTASPQLMTDLFRRHLELELTMDTDAVMSTFTTDAEPFWEGYPMGIRLEGHDAIRQFYKRLLPDLSPRVVGGDEHWLTVRESMVVCDYTADLRWDSGEVRRHNSLATMSFLGDAILGERVFNDAGTSTLVMRALGDDIWDVPGVVRVGG
jgi:hypothetical protein